MSLLGPRLSVIVEWDNARYYEIQRATLMLRRLLAQLGELGLPAEILLVFDARAIDEARVRAVVADLAGRTPVDVEIAAIPTQGLRYYQLKNEGARKSRGDILLFVDSDVIPDDGWLAALIGAFDDRAVQIVMADPYVDADTLYGKAFALAWYFPSRRTEGPPAPTTRSFVNSIAFRRETFRRHPFPEDRGLYIAQCIDFTQTLRGSGIDVYVHPRARIRHPPPTFFRSAVINGHDIVVRQRRAGDARARASYWRLRGNLATAAARVRTEHRTVGLSPRGACVAIAIASAYYVVSFLAEMLTWISPRLVHRLYAL